MPKLQRFLSKLCVGRSVFGYCHSSKTQTFHVNSHLNEGIIFKSLFFTQKFLIFNFAFLLTTQISMSNEIKYSYIRMLFFCNGKIRRWTSVSWAILVELLIAILRFNFFSFQADNVSSIRTSQNKTCKNWHIKIRSMHIIIRSHRW